MFFIGYAMSKSGLKRILAVSAQTLRSPGRCDAITDHVSLGLFGKTWPLFLNFGEVASFCKPGYRFAREAALWLWITLGRSAGQWMLLPLCSRTLQRGMNMSCTVLIKAALESSAETNEGHSLALTEIMQPGGKVADE